jgi:ferrous iron transport protein B
MIKMFDGKVGAFSYLLFILLYMPCAAAVAAVFHEAGFKWSLLCASWTTILAYSSAVSFYQLANFSANPIESIVWFASMIILIIVFYYIITFIAKKAKKLSKL